jgi:hypothetical protein
MPNDSQPGACCCGHSRSYHGLGYERCEKLPPCPCAAFKPPDTPVLKYLSGYSETGTRDWPLVTTIRGRVAHVLDEKRKLDTSDPALCHRDPFPYTWRHGSNNAERKRTLSLPVCGECMKWLADNLERIKAQ